RLRLSGQRDRHPQHAGDFKEVRIASTYRASVSTTVCTALLVPFTTLCPTFLAVFAVLFATLAAVWTEPARTPPLETATARMIEKNTLIVLKYSSPPVRVRANLIVRCGWIADSSSTNAVAFSSACTNVTLPVAAICVSTEAVILSLPRRR